MRQWFFNYFGAVMEKMEIQGFACFYENTYWALILKILIETLFKSLLRHSGSRP
jgi:hypothetical protein